MTTNDKQIDGLMRHAARKLSGPAAGVHLDADEMNAFAEGSLPSTARAQYMAHLADCDSCRRQVAQLAISAGASVRSESKAAEKGERLNLWASFAGIFTGRVLRYAAFAAMVLIVAGVTFIALRRPQKSADLVASGQRVEEHPGNAIVPQAPLVTNPSEANKSASPNSSSQPARANEPRRGESSGVSESSVPPVQPAKETAAPLQTESKQEVEPDVARAQPSYAPAPPGEGRAQQQTAVGGSRPMAGRMTDQPADKVSTSEDERTRVAKKDVRDDAKSAGLTTAPRAGLDEKSKGGPSRNIDNTASIDRNTETRGQPKTLNSVAEDREAPQQVRSVGGHKFRKQGSAWIDQKFTSGMSIKTVLRGSDEFNELDSGLRSIAQQIGGEVIVVWKGKAYLIK